MEGFGYDAPDFFHGDAFLLHCVAVAKGYLAVIKRVHVYGHAEGGPDFVLSAVEFADGGGVVIDGVEVGFQISGEFAGFFDEFWFVF